MFCEKFGEILKNARNGNQQLLCRKNFEIFRILWKNSAKVKKHLGQILTEFSKKQIEEMMKIFCQTLNKFYRFLNNIFVKMCTNFLHTLRKLLKIFKKF